MKTWQCFDKILLQKLAIAVVALLLALTFATLARAEALSHYQPQALVDAATALDEGQPERALAHLRRGRAVLRDARFRLQREALECQAYIQLRQAENADRVCNEVVAYDGDEAAVAPYDSPAR